MGFKDEFKQFAIRGNALDMAAGIIIGAAFNKIVQSIVNDLVMPPIGLMIGGVDFRDLQVVLQEQLLLPDGTIEQAEVAIRYGMFVTTVIEFLIIAFTVFVMVKFMSKLITLRDLRFRQRGRAPEEGEA